MARKKPAAFSEEWASLGDDAKEFLLAAALYDVPLPPSGPEHFGTGDGSVDDLLEHGFLAGAGQGLALGPNCSRDAVIACAEWSRRRRIHLSLARLCTRPPPRFEAAGRHYEAAGRNGEAARAYLSAADAHCRRHHHRSAARCFEIGLRLLPANTADDEVARAIEGLEKCASLSEEYERAIQLLGDWAGSPPWSERPAVRSQVNLALAALYAKSLRHAESGRARLKAAEDLFMLGCTHEAASAALAAAATLSYSLQLRNAKAAVTQALDGAARAGDPELESRAAMVHGFVIGALGNPAAGRKEVERALEIALANHLTGAAGAAYQTLGYIADFASRYEDERDALAHAISYCRKNDQRDTADLCMGCLSYSLFRAGDWRKAEAITREVIAKRRAPPVSRCVAEGILGLMLAYRGEQRKAARLLASSHEAARQTGVAGMEFYCLHGLAVVAEAAGRTDDAAAHLLQLLDTWRATDDRHDAIPGLTHMVSFFAENSRPGDAAVAAEALDRIAASTVNPEASGAAMAARGELRWLEGRAGLAVRDFRVALASFEERKLPLEQIRVRLRLGLALRSTGNDDEGRGLLLDARNRARRLGARPLAAKVDLALSASNGNAATESWDLLSERQREVARHLARGSTNKEIAGQLGLSVRTIDMHVANILGRLDCRTRSEAAARITAVLG